MSDKPNDRIVMDADDLEQQPNPKIWLTAKGKQILKPAPMMYLAGDEDTLSTEGAAAGEGASPESYCLCNSVCTCNSLSGGWNGSSGSRRICSCVPVYH